MDPFQWAIIKVLNCLRYLSHSGFECRTNNCHRCAISVYQEYVDNKPLGQHPHVCPLLKKVFNYRPPQSRYVFIWYIQAVLDFIKWQWIGYENLSDNVFFYNVVILMALSSAFRASAILHLDVTYMLRQERKFVFTFHKLHKR